MTTSPPPRRGTPAYRHALRQLTQAPPDTGIAGLVSVWNIYGHHGVADAMTQWVADIDNAPLSQHPRLRDMFGAVRITALLNHDEERALRTATQQATTSTTWDPLVFGDVMDAHDLLADTYNAWIETLQDALRAQAAGQHALVRAALLRNPHITDRTSCIAAAASLDVCAHGLRNPSAL